MGSVPDEDLPHKEDLPRLLASDLNKYFPAFYKIYRDDLFHFAKGLTHNGDDAEDVVQVAFWNACRALKKTKAEEIARMNLGSWLYTIAYRCFVDGLRAQKINMVSLDTLEGRQFADNLVDYLFEQPETVAENSEFCQKVYTLLKSLPPKYSVALVLRHIRGLRYREIAKILHISVDEAKGYVAYGLKKLYDAASDQGYHNSACFR